MRKEIIETGKTVEAAIEAACEKLGCERENCDWEIIDMQRKAFFGLKTYPAKVKVWIEVPEERPIQTKKPERKPQPVFQEHRSERRESRKQEQRREAPKPAPTQQRSRPVDDDALMPPTRVLVTEGFTDKETLAMSYITSILKEFGIVAKLVLSREGNGICVNITGDGLGTIIGRRGETLDAIQYLSGLVANRLEGDYMRVTVDCGDYRNKRKETLEALAKKLSAQVLKTNVSKTLEPMNPFERRVIHATVSKIEGVSSSSVGEEPNRRVVITSPTSRRPSPVRNYGKDGERREGGRGNRDGERRPSRDRGATRGNREMERRSSRGARPPAPKSHEGPPKETPESAAMGDKPYGKLDLE